VPSDGRSGTIHRQALRWVGSATGPAPLPASSLLPRRTSISSTPKIMHITSSSPLLTATFQGQHDLVRAGDAIDLTAHLELELDSKGLPKIESVTAELRGTQVTTFVQSRPNPGPVGSQRRTGASEGARSDVGSASVG
jgi:hypothetical protein